MFHRHSINLWIVSGIHLLTSGVDAWVHEGGEEEGDYNKEIEEPHIDDSNNGDDHLHTSTAEIGEEVPYPTEGGGGGGGGERSEQMMGREGR